MTELTRKKGREYGQIVGKKKQQKEFAGKGGRKKVGCEKGEVRWIIHKESLGGDMHSRKSRSWGEKPSSNSRNSAGREKRRDLCTWIKTNSGRASQKDKGKKAEPR